MQLPSSASPVLALAIVVLTGLAACGDDDPTDPGESETVTITLSNFRFSDDDVTVDVGSTVRWVNGENVFHTVTPDGHTEWVSWSTDASGQDFEHTFDEEGIYAYYCAPHRQGGMTGTVRVE